MLEVIGRSLAIGIGATALLDLWAIFLNRAFGIPLANWAMVGRWFAYLPRGRFTHDTIADTPPVSNELAIGWIMHYLIGALFAAIVIMIWGLDWARNPTLLPALIVGIVTVGCGWFILQPGMGFGLAASKRPNANQVRLIGLINHVVFGLSLWLAALLMR
ncbi:conserved membrane hypothetical protein [Bosea sp. 62]|uniref:DUF2938 domain-containing protein n=1 Tax=unclassified Bosea (in: a-proteobacteria) TaxID=2653178 RepID=UPI00125188FA|nr:MULTISPECIES: DUF2938 domain-containing protein [unclassified Bosea (in: a-proteobacteria)]CAD5252578.1 conserved membrane hypothetical protein [Bosea sp. 7B]CAD5278808.1 conserved membrane hypothetical protein [Bosea sp. 21B]CAD5279922.1 conserved membrane hypothetical protein [Bosea sp. 46]VVT59610.1 conserved membrane hypothetical protein [Bosea sp. EC-HK365B]VXB36111.1 conserved membrane hypothetical protein [Bosea sp. 62]